MVMAFRSRATSYLSGAMATDVELYEANEAANEKTSGVSAPDTTEVDLLTSLVMGIHELLQMNVHFTAAQAPRKTKKPKVQRLPRPVGAKELLAKKRTREAYNTVNNMITFVSTAEYRRIVAEAETEGRDNGEVHRWRG